MNTSFGTPPKDMFDAPIHAALLAKSNPTNKEGLGELIKVLRVSERGLWDGREGGQLEFTFIARECIILISFSIM